MKSQRQGVYDAIVALGYEIPATGFKPTKEQKREIVELVTDGILAGEIRLSDEAKAKYDTREKLATKYVGGMVDNWLRKDTELNGGTKHVIKNPGSRTGQGDELLKNLKLMKAKFSGTENEAKIQAEIEKRTAELKVAKAPKVEINVDILPDSLKDLLSAE